MPSGLVHPPELGPEVSALIVLPDQVTLADARRFVDVDAAGFEPMRVRHPSPLTGIAHELTYFISTFESTRRIALHVMARSRRRFGRPADLFVLFRIIDKTSHTALQLSTLVDDHVAASPDGPRAIRRRRHRGLSRSGRAPWGRSWPPPARPTSSSSPITASVSRAKARSVATTTGKGRRAS